MSPENQFSRMSEGLIRVHEYGGTYIARFRRKTASCTSGSEAAARAVARKVLGNTLHMIEKQGYGLYTVLSKTPTI